MVFEHAFAAYLDTELEFSLLLLTRSIAGRFSIEIRGATKDHDTDPATANRPFRIGGANVREGQLAGRPY